MKYDFTKAEYAILGLLVEKPAHGYDLERLIEQRGMREWTELGFSSIYYLLKKLEARGIVGQQSPKKSDRKTRKTYAPTEIGVQLHRKMTLQFLAQPQPAYPAILLGIANWPAVERSDALDALKQRRKSIEKKLEHVSARMGLVPDFVEVHFDYSISLLRAELGWIEKSLAKLGESNEN